MFSPSRLPIELTVGFSAIYTIFNEIFTFYFFRGSEILHVFYPPAHLSLEIKFVSKYLVCIETLYRLQLEK